jgi:cytochrome b
MQIERGRVRVWDPFVRVFHWSLVLAFVTAWASAEEWDWLHEQTGYFILALIGLRVLWGLLGSTHARFSDFLYGPGSTLAYLKGLLSGRPQHYLGHNPAGGWMVVVLMLALLATGASGMLIGGASGHEFWEDLHEGFANLTLFLVVVHVGGVLLSSLLHEENLIRAMWTGVKMRRDADV